MNTITDFILVDDDPFNNMLCEMSIKSEINGARVCIFEDGATALTYLRQTANENRKPTLLLLDINMPVMTGWEFMEFFEELPLAARFSLEIYILSSSVDPRDEEQAASNPVIKGFISKPIENKTIRSIATVNLPAA